MELRLRLHVASSKLNIEAYALIDEGLTSRVYFNIVEELHVGLEPS